MEKKHDLKPCPFCGMEVAMVYTQSERDEIQCDPERYTIVCSWTENGCGATCGYHSTVSKAIKRWNTRVVIE